MKKFKTPPLSVNKTINPQNFILIMGEFISRIDKEMVNESLIASYIMLLLNYRLKYSPRVKGLMLATYFHDVGKLYDKDGRDVHNINSYLYLKYYSPLSKFAGFILHEDIQNFKDLSVKSLAGVFVKMVRDYTHYVIQTKDAKKSFDMLAENDYNYNPENLLRLKVLIEQNNLVHDINAGVARSAIYKYFNKLKFARRQMLDFIIMLSSLFEMYNETTHAHSKLTATIAYELAYFMDYKKDICTKIYVAGLFHDLGKVSIPVNIIEKPGKLDPDEYEIMKKHVVYTREIIGQHVDPEIAELACRHHERLDGSGYPEGLKSCDLTEEQRILEVADVISALLAKRSYKEAFDYDKVVEILEDNIKNNKLDKKIIDVFKSNSKLILEYSNTIVNEDLIVYESMNKEREKLLKKYEG